MSQLHRLHTLVPLPQTAEMSFKSTLTDILVPPHHLLATNCTLPHPVRPRTASSMTDLVEDVEDAKNNP